MALEIYRKKRSFDETPETQDAVRRDGRGRLRFVVQRHEASRLHYDFRLEAEGVLKSWAVPKGPSMNPAEKRLAAQVEDHPYSYRMFEGVIPEGNYGAGSVIVWDEGTYSVPGMRTHAETEAAVIEGLRHGQLSFVLKGHRLHGEFTLVRMHGRGDKNWLLIKKRDQYASTEDVAEDVRSVRTNRTNQEVAGGKVTRDKRKSPPRKIETMKSIRRTRPSTGLVEPMLATLVDKPFDRHGWYFEVKWDGYRAIAEINNGKVHLYSRNHKSFDDRYGEIVETLKGLDVQAVLDGEIVVVDTRGRSHFQLLQNYQNTGKGPLLYYVFDLLELNGVDLRPEPLRVRRQKQEKLVRGLPNVKNCEYVKDRGKAYFSKARRLGLEGILAKDAESPYLEGVRSHTWLKIKAQMGQEAIIGGFTAPKGSRKYLGALVLGVYEGDELVYIGLAGGGFNRHSLQEVYDRLKPLVRRTSPFTRVPKTRMPVQWVEPKLVCNVKFEEWTSDGRIRQPIFLGLREDKAPRSVHRERAVPEPLPVTRKGIR